MPLANIPTHVALQEILKKVTFSMREEFVELETRSYLVFKFSPPLTTEELNTLETLFWEEGLQKIDEGLAGPEWTHTESNGTITEARIFLNKKLDRELKGIEKPAATLQQILTVLHAHGAQPADGTEQEIKVRYQQARSNGKVLLNAASLDEVTDENYFTNSELCCDGTNAVFAGLQLNAFAQWGWGVKTLDRNTLSSLITNAESALNTRQDQASFFRAWRYKAKLESLQNAKTRLSGGSMGSEDAYKKTHKALNTHTNLLHAFAQWLWCLSGKPLPECLKTQGAKDFEETMKPYMDPRSNTPKYRQFGQLF